MAKVREPPVERVVPGREYHVLSMWPEWAWAIVYAGKDVENRGRNTHYRGRILIHASSHRSSRKDLERNRRFIAANSGIPLSRIPEEFPTSQLAGSVELADCVTRHKSPWAFRGEKHWVVHSPHRVADRWPLHGKLGIWKWSPDPTK